MLFIISNVTGQSAGDRPDGSCLENLRKGRMGKKTRNTSVSVEERVNPDKTMMHGGRCKKGFGFAEIRIDLFKASHESLN